MDDADMGPCTGAGWTLVMKTSGRKVRNTISFNGQVATATVWSNARVYPKSVSLSLVADDLRSKHLMQYVHFSFLSSEALL